MSWYLSRHRWLQMHFDFNFLVFDFLVTPYFLCYYSFIIYFFLFSRFKLLFTTRVIYFNRCLFLDTFTINLRLQLRLETFTLIYSQFHRLFHNFLIYRSNTLHSLYFKIRLSLFSTISQTFSKNIERKTMSRTHTQIARH